MIKLILKSDFIFKFSDVSLTCGKLIILFNACTIITKKQKSEWSTCICLVTFLTCERIVTIIESKKETTVGQIEKSRHLEPACIRFKGRQTNLGLMYVSLPYFFCKRIFSGLKLLTSLVT